MKMRLWRKLVCVDRELINGYEVVVGCAEHGCSDRRCSAAAEFSCCNCHCVLRWGLLSGSIVTNLLRLVYTRLIFCS